MVKNKVKDKGSISTQAPTHLHPTLPMRDDTLKLRNDECPLYISK